MFRLAMVVWCALSVLQAQNTGKIAGRVVDAVTRQPIPRAHVSSNTGGPGQRFIGALTGTDGSYALDDVPPGAITMTVNLDGYQTIHEDAVPSAAFPLAAGETVRRDFAMRPLGVRPRNLVGGGAKTASVDLRL